MAFYMAGIRDNSEFSINTVASTFIEEHGYHILDSGKVNENSDDHY